MELPPLVDDSLVLAPMQGYPDGAIVAVIKKFEARLPV
jgi:hypothetical protein